MQGRGAGRRWRERLTTWNRASTPWGKPSSALPSPLSSFRPLPALLQSVCAYAARLNTPAIAHTDC